MPNYAKRAFVPRLGALAMAAGAPSETPASFIDLRRNVGRIRPSDNSVRALFHDDKCVKLSTALDAIAVVATNILNSKRFDKVTLRNEVLEFDSYISGLSSLYSYCIFRERDGDSFLQDIANHSGYESCVVEIAVRSSPQKLLPRLVCHEIAAAAQAVRFGGSGVQLVVNTIPEHQTPIGAANALARRSITYALKARPF